MEKLLRLRKPQQLPVNVLGQQKKEQDVENERNTQVDVVITINKINIAMSKDFLFAINTDTEEVIISESAKGTNKINYIERIKKSDNEMLYHAVNTLTSITKSSNYDVTIFKAMDKVCQLMYSKHKKH